MSLAPAEPEVAAPKQVALTQPNWQVPRLPEKRRVFGVNISKTNYRDLTDLIIHRAKSGQPLTAQFMSVHGLVMAARGGEFAKISEGFDVTATDGQPVRWAHNRFTDARIDKRVYGPDTTASVLKAAERENVGVYFYGGSDESLAQLLVVICERFPNLNIAGSEAPPFRPLSDEEHNEVARRVAQSGAGIMLIGLGCPKQEQFVHRHRGDINAVMLAVGAAFDFLAGTKSTAPQWMQDRGLEWAYRLATEPRRLWRRYLLNNSHYLRLWAREEFRRLRG